MSIVVVMDDFTEIRNWLAGMRGKFPAIARSTGLSTKTLSRIANDPEYSVNLRTLNKLRAQKATQAQPA